MPSDSRPLLVTGANGHIGRALLATLAQEKREAVAAVRSQPAADALAASLREASIEIRLVDYERQDQLEEAARGCAAALHLVGILKESPTTRYEQAHEASCRALAKAAERSGLERILYLSILGADPASPNPCLASKGRGERILLEGSVPTTVLRLPMVLGRGDYASLALRKQATAKLLPLVAGGRTLHQPVDARDLIRGLLACTGARGGARCLDLGGPESLSERDLVRRAARQLERTPLILGIPLSIVRAVAAAMERLSSNPPLTRAMLEVLQHDDCVDSAAAWKELGVGLTPLDETLRWCLEVVDSAS